METMGGGVGGWDEACPRIKTKACHSLHAAHCSVHWEPLAVSKLVITQPAGNCGLDGQRRVGRGSSTVFMYVLGDALAHSLVHVFWQI